MKSITKKVIITGGVVLMTALIGVAYADSSSGEPSTVAVTSVKHIDLQQYLGKWYEVARLPMFFERNCADNVSATYSLNPDASIKVDNQCRKDNGKVMQSIGEAVPVDATNARLSVTFLPKWLRWTGLAKAPYWILKIDEHYTTALVGNPDHRYLWILSRTPQIDPVTYQAYLQEAQRQGFDTRKLIVTQQH